MPEHKEILTHLEQEHREVEQLFAKLQDSQPGQTRNALVKELTDALGTHMAVEERFVYPLVSQRIGTEERTEASNEHELAREGLASLQQLRDQPGFGAAVDMLSAGVAHHVHEEEETLFPELREKAAAAIEQLDPNELEHQIRAGTAPAVEAPEAEHERSAAAAASAKPKPRTPQPKARPQHTARRKHVDLDLTKDELYKQAQAADIPGRSTMTKAELVDALNDA